jgi:hypothetical protein
MDTKVPLLDGRTLTIAEIAEEYKDNELWAYSCDPITGKFAPGKITWAGVARRDAKLIRITLDNGKTVDCTYDHKFPVWGKNMVQAQDLLVGDSMIPLYRKQEPIIMPNGNKYEMIWDNDAKDWKFTHREVSNWKDSFSVDNTFSFKEEYIEYSKNTVHHKNVNRFDNSPSNLVRMYSKDHTAWHKENGDISGRIGGKRSAEFGKSQKSLAKGREKFAELMLDAEFNESFKKQQSENWTLQHREDQSNLAINMSLSEKGNAAQKEQWKTLERREKHATMYSIEYPIEMFEFLQPLVPTMTKEQVATEINQSESLLDLWKLTNATKCLSPKQKTFDRITVRDIERISKEYAGCTYSKFKEQLKHKNHKIAKIEYLDDVQDVGCLTIDGSEEFHDYHTFALDAGIYTQNSVLEDYWMPRRSSGRTTEITTLPGD